MNLVLFILIRPSGYTDQLQSFLTDDLDDAVLRFLELAERLNGEPLTNSQENVAILTQRFGPVPSVLEKDNKYLLILSPDPSGLQKMGEDAVRHQEI